MPPRGLWRTEQGSAHGDRALLLPQNRITNEALGPRRQRAVRADPSRMCQGSECRLLREALRCCISMWCSIRVLSRASSNTGPGVEPLAATLRPGALSNLGGIPGGYDALGFQNFGRVFLTDSELLEFWVCLSLCPQ